jgi:hypothetical protein
MWVVVMALVVDNFVSCSMDTSDAAYWRAICPRLHVSAQHNDACPLQPSHEETTELKKRMVEDGYFSVPPRGCMEARVALLAEGVRQLRRAGWPATFLLMYLSFSLSHSFLSLSLSFSLSRDHLYISVSLRYDEAWDLVHHLSAIMTSTTGNAECIMDVVSWYIDPDHEAGFSVHRDRAFGSLEAETVDTPASFREDGTPKYCTCWIALTECHPDNGTLITLIILTKSHPGHGTTSSLSLSHTRTHRHKLFIFLTHAHTHAHTSSQGVCTLSRPEWTPATVRVTDSRCYHRTTYRLSYGASACPLPVCLCGGPTKTRRSGTCGHFLSLPAARSFCPTGFCTGAVRAGREAPWVRASPSPSRAPTRPSSLHTSNRPSHHGHPLRSASCSEPRRCCRTASGSNNHPNHPKNPDNPHNPNKTLI